MLMSGETTDVYHGVSWKTPFDGGEYLQHNGVTVKQNTVPAAHDEAGIDQLEEAKRFNADLLVMGAYGRNRFSEWTLGGVTRHVLKRIEVPLLHRH